MCKSIMRVPYLRCDPVVEPQCGSHVAIAAVDVRVHRELDHRGAIGSKQHVGQASAVPACPSFMRELE